MPPSLAILLLMQPRVQLVFWAPKHPFSLIVSISSSSPPRTLSAGLLSIPSSFPLLLKMGAVFSSGLTMSCRGVHNAGHLREMSGRNGRKGKTNLSLGAAVWAEAVVSGRVYKHLVKDKAGEALELAICQGNTV